MKKVLILNGPNLNMLGTREPGIYGNKTLADIKQECEQLAPEIGLSVDFRQSNNEGEIVGWIQESAKSFSGIIINAGAYTHTSIAIRDALLGVETPIIEVHISNIFKREEFRHHSYISPVAEGMICGFGTDGYAMALRAIAAMVA